MMKIALAVVILTISFLFSGFFRPDTGRSGRQNQDLFIDSALSRASIQYKVLIKQVPPEVMPRSYDAVNDLLLTSDTRWWTSGFYPGTLLYLYEYSGDTALLNEAGKRLAILEKEKHYTGNHDLGFMIFCSFGNALRITGNALYKEIILTAAESLSTRYRPAVRAIQSWEAGAHFHCPVIIDNMMNLELLCWASENGGNPRYWEIAVTHANTTLANHFRNDNSSWHVVDYDPLTGDVIRKMTWQGLADSSAWARGQSWGLYGFTMMYRFTRDPAYLEKAQSIAKFCLSHHNIPDNLIPFWDYDAPASPGTLHDASSAAIMASALIELSEYVRQKESRSYIDAARKILVSLSSAEYTAVPGTNGGFILRHSVGALPFNNEIDVPLTYADYYYVEALMRFKKNNDKRINEKKHK